MLTAIHFDISSAWLPGVLTITDITVYILILMTLAGMNLFFGKSTHGCTD